MEDIKLSWCKKHKQWWVMNCPDCMAETVDEEWKERGYRKLPKDKPPLLGRREIFSNRDIESGIATFGATLRIAKAQRRADIKFYTKPA